jgi:hypothetical protein
MPCQCRGTAYYWAVSPAGPLHTQIELLGVGANLSGASSSYKVGDGLDVPRPVASPRGSESGPVRVMIIVDACGVHTCGLGVGGHSRGGGGRKHISIHGLGTTLSRSSTTLLHSANLKYLVVL